MAPPLDRMIERPELAERVLAALLEQDNDQVALTTSLLGAGGFGKTILATWVCHQTAIAERFPAGVLWVTLGQEVHGADLAAKINDLSFMLSGRRPALADPDAAGAKLAGLVHQRGPVLLVVDDVWTASQLRPFRFGTNGCVRLITTRVPDLLPSDGPRIPVDAMSPDQARELVIDRVDGLPDHMGDQLATLAGRWPVLLNLVNGALRQRVARGQAPENAAASIVERLAFEGPTALDAARPDDRSQAVAATVGASLSLLCPTDRERYLDLAVFPEDVDVPLEILRLLWPDRRVEALCEDLVGLGLVAELRLGPLGTGLVMHDVMHAYVRSCRSGAELAALHGRLVDAAAAQLRGEQAEQGGQAEQPEQRDQAEHADQPVPWWELPADTDYLWRHLAYHLQRAGREGDLTTLLCDLRWIEAKTRRLGSVVSAEADLALARTPTARTLRRALRRAAPILGPIEPPAALGATLLSQLANEPELRSNVARYRATLPRPRLEHLVAQPGEPAWATARSDVVGHAGAVTSCDFSPDGSRLVTAGDDAVVLLWTLPDATEQLVLTGHTASVLHCAFAPDGSLLATASNDRTARLWQTADGVTEAVLSHPDKVTGCAFSPDMALLATTSDDGGLRLWDIGNRDQTGFVQAHDGRATSCAFSPDRRHIATAGADGTARLWTFPEGKARRVLAGHAGLVTSCAFSPDGHHIATTGDDGTVRIWTTADGTMCAVLRGHHHRVWRCAFSPDGHMLASAGVAGELILWDLRTMSPAAALDGHRAAVLSCAFAPGGRVLATTSIDQTVRLWEVTERREQAVLTGARARIVKCAFSPDGRLLATTSLDGTASLWNTDDGSNTAILDGASGGMRGCAFSPDGRLLATATSNSTVILWDLARRSIASVLRGHGDWAIACAFSPDGQLIASTSHDTTVRLWQVANGALHATLIGHSSVVCACAFSPDGDLVATSSFDKTIRLWRVPDGTPARVLVGHTEWVNSCAFSPDGTLLASASDDGTVRSWQLPSGRPGATLAGHTGRAEACAFSPDGTVLASASDDGTVRIWQVSQGSCLAALRVAGPLIGLAWHPDGTKLCAVGGTGIHLLRYLP